MKKTFCVSVDITMAKNIYVEAESEEQAKLVVLEMIDKNPYDYARGFSHLVGCKIIDVEEE